MASTVSTSITPTLVDQHVEAFAAELKEAERQIGYAERELRQARDRRDAIQRRYAAFVAFAQTLKELR